MGFPGGAVAKNPPANTGDKGSIPGPGRFHMARATKPVLQSPRAATTEPMSCNYWSLHAKASTHNERAPVLQLLKSSHHRASKLQLLSPSATTTQACSPRTYALQQEKPLRWEDRAPQRESSPCSPEPKKKESSKIHSWSLYISKKADQDTWPNWSTIKIKIKEGEKRCIAWFLEVHSFPTIINTRQMTAPFPFPS